MRIIAAVPAVLALLAAACDGLPTAPSPKPDAPPGGAVLAELTCTATLAQPSLTCRNAAPELGAASGALIVGRQGVYVQLTSTTPAYNPADSIFSVDVTVGNLMAQALGTPDGETDTGVRVFFYTDPETTAGTGFATVHNEDGSDIFLAGPQPYFAYAGPLETGVASEGRTWEFKVDPEVETFRIKLLVQGQLPHEQSLLLIRPWYEPEETLVLGIWGAAASEVFAVGLGPLLRYTAGMWVEDENPSDEFLLDVWGSSAADVFAVGTGGVILHWDGVSWQEMDSGLDPCGCDVLFGVWGSGPNDVWAVGSGGVITHYDGTAWTAADTMPVTSLNGVWGSGPADVFAVGEEGGIFHYDGTGWTPMVSGLEETGEWINRVWGLSSTDVYAPASIGMLHWDGVEWSLMEDLPLCEHAGVWGTAPDDLFVSNECGVMHYDGSTWAYMDPGGGSPTALWGSGPLNVLMNTGGGLFRGTR